MQSALYGRMSLGRCLPTDLGYMGCQADVLSQFDKECSGKESCEIWATDAHINVQGGCLKGLSSYLQAQYKCVKGIIWFSHLRCFLKQVFNTLLCSSIIHFVHYCSNAFYVALHIHYFNVKYFKL